MRTIPSRFSSIWPATGPPFGASSRSAYGSNIKFSIGWISRSGSIRIAILLVSTPAIFLVTVTCIEKNPKARLVLEQARYIVILVVAALLGAYLHATHKDQSYESALREGAVLACAKISACAAAAIEYANTR